jgi:hypothetical protein
MSTAGADLVWGTSSHHLQRMEKGALRRLSVEINASYLIVLALHCFDSLLPNL